MTRAMHVDQISLCRVRLADVGAGNRSGVDHHFRAQLLKGGPHLVEFRDVRFGPPHGKHRVSPADHLHESLAEQSCRTGNRYFHNIGS